MTPVFKTTKEDFNTQVFNAVLNTVFNAVGPILNDTNLKLKTQNTHLFSIFCISYSIEFTN